MYFFNQTSIHLIQMQSFCICLSVYFLSLAVIQPPFVVIEFIFANCFFKNSIVIFCEFAYVRVFRKVDLKSLKQFCLSEREKSRPNRMKGIEFWSVKLCQMWIRFRLPDYIRSWCFDIFLISLSSLHWLLVPTSS